MARTASPLVDAILRYSVQTLPQLLESAPVVSPLAPWMLVALVAPGATGTELDALEHILGVDAPRAQDEVDRLLRQGPPALRSAVAVWRSARLATVGDLATWEAALPSLAAHGPVPDQSTADAWTAERTSGLIERFPLSVDDTTLAVLAAAIATRISWDVPLGVVDAPTNGWGLQRMLVADGEGVFETTVGLVGVARAGSREQRLAVYSFIAETGVERKALVAVVASLLRTWAASDRHPVSVSPSALPSDGHSWRIRDGRGNHTAVVPAFGITADGIDIGSLAGIREASSVLARLVGDAAPADMRPVGVEASLSTVARYDRIGFEAAAVAAMGMVAGAALDPHRLPTVHLRFVRPHLVVAVSTDDDYRYLPLFAAWVDLGVTEPTEDEHADDRRPDVR